MRGSDPTSEALMGPGQDSSAAGSLSPTLFPPHFHLLGDPFPGEGLEALQAGFPGSFDLAGQTGQHPMPLAISAPMGDPPGAFDAAFPGNVFAADPFGPTFGPVRRDQPWGGRHRRTLA
jgi:hypothetical protein